MNTVLYFSPDGVVYETRAYTRTDIRGLVDNCGLESFLSLSTRKVTKRDDRVLSRRIGRDHRGLNRRQVGYQPQVTVARVERSS